MSILTPVKPRWKKRTLQAAIWVACWGFLVPALVLAFTQVPAFGEFVNSWPVALTFFTIFSLPVLAFIGLVSGFWTWRTRFGMVRLLILIVTVALYWYCCGRGITKLVFGGMG